jgi:hypothetical protein
MLGRWQLLARLAEIFLMAAASSGSGDGLP